MQNTRIINLKITEPFADAVLDGRKTFEVRYNDRFFQVGDLIRFTVIADNLKKEEIPHPLNNVFYEIEYVLSDYYAINTDFVVFSIRECGKIDECECDE